MNLNFSRLCRILLLSLFLLTTGCRVEYHPYDTRIEGATNINARNIARIEAATTGKRMIRFAVISDTQRWYDETELAVKSINRQEAIDFVLHTGDMADFGMKAEFERQRDILNKLHAPYVCLIGNHDCLASGERVFKKIFGDPDFAFTAGNIRFVCLNTNALEYDHSSAVPDFEFIGNELTSIPEGIEKSIVAMHAKPYTEQFDNNIADFFQQTIRQFPALQFCINGHGHNFCIEDVFEDGILYYECDAISGRSYLIFTLDDNGYEYERVAY
ncbi:MAG: metallophosphoesterase [Rikenellaceae bacterium]|nr:metallophosphoesterase [Rikenellaceae bacterium]